MTRVRTDNVFGTITDNPLTNVATTMNSAGLANLAAVSSAEAIIILDPNRVSGAPEIVVVTAHTGSATSATIQRGQFGTAARQHAQGTEWVHGPIASNATSYATAADDQGDYVPMNAWASWSPTWTNVTVGNGTLAAAYVRIGRTIHARLRLLFGSTTTISGSAIFTLPVTAASAYETNDIIGTAYLQDTGTVSLTGVVHSGATEASAFVTVLNTAGTYAVPTGLSGTVPFTWTTNDLFMVAVTYEAST